MDSSINTKMVLLGNRQTIYNLGVKGSNDEAIKCLVVSYILKMQKLRCIGSHIYKMIEHLAMEALKEGYVLTGFTCRLEQDTFSTIIKIYGRR